MKYRSDDHIDYNVFGSKNTKDMEKVLRDRIEPGVIAYVFCSAVQNTPGMTRPLWK